jgi:hypothetical protein
MLRVRVTLDGWSGGPGLSTFYFTATTEDAAAAARVRGYVQTYMVEAVKGQSFNGMTWTVQPEVDLITSADGHITNTFVGTASLTGTGTGGAGEAPPSVALLGKLTTATFIGGHRLRGRTFVSPLASGVLDTTGQFSATALGFYASGVATFLAAIGSGDALVVWHRPKAGSGGASGVVTGMAGQRKLATLKSRRD